MTDRSKTLELARALHRAGVDDALETAHIVFAHLQAEGMAVVPGWQPMETAPKDGTQFLMLGDPKRYGRPIWIDRWWGVNYDGEQVVTPRWENAGHHNPPASLLGWMPLPAPPASPYGKAVVKEESDG